VIHMIQELFGQTLRGSPRKGSVISSLPSNVA
jgi:hypothetical protein